MDRGDGDLALLVFVLELCFKSWRCPNVKLVVHAANEADNDFPSEMRFRWRQLTHSTRGPNFAARSFPSLLNSMTVGTWA